MGKHSFIRFAMLVGLCTLGTLAIAQERLPIEWKTDYPAAYRAAETGQKLLAIHFADSSAAKELAEWEQNLFAAPEFAQAFADVITLRLPLDYRTADDDAEIRLIDHRSMGELHGQPGLVLVDFRDPEAKHFAKVVSLLPFAPRRPSMTEVTALADLPAGSLTQRTLIWAVRTHAESPASAKGRFEPILAVATESHSQHQANLRRQGHHGWQSRFHELNAKLGNGLIAQEVCAESWPGESLVDAARECVRSWRQSPGHWKAVSGKAACYGYDLKRGSNGIWYATGIFGR